METTRELLFRDVRHACATLGIGDLHCFTLRNDRTALFKGVYYHPLRKGQEWCLVAKHRRFGGIAIKRVARLNQWSDAEIHALYPSEEVEA